MSTLSTQTSKYNVVITDKHNTISIEALKEFLNANALQYAFIKHDKDVSDNGEMKTLHYHVVVLNSVKKRQRLSTILTALAVALQVNTMAISIEPLKNDIGSLQYLLHKNDAEKYQYSKSDIVTNIDLKELDTYLLAENDNITIDRLVYLCTTCNNLIEVMQAVGLGRYHIYRNVIHDIWKNVSR